MPTYELALDNCYAHCMHAVSPPPEASRWSLSSWLAAALARMAEEHCPVTLQMTSKPRYRGGYVQTRLKRCPLPYKADG
jgi:hypothetical protein